MDDKSTTCEDCGAEICQNCKIHMDPIFEDLKPDIIGMTFRSHHCSCCGDWVIEINPHLKENFED